MGKITPGVTPEDEFRRVINEAGGNVQINTTPANLLKALKDIGGNVSYGSGDVAIVPAVNEGGDNKYLFDLSLFAEVGQGTYNSVGVDNTKLLPKFKEICKKVWDLQQEDDHSSTLTIVDVYGNAVTGPFEVYGIPQPEEEGGYYEGEIRIDDDNWFYIYTHPIDERDESSEEVLWCDVQIDGEMPELKTPAIFDLSQFGVISPGLYTSEELDDDTVSEIISNVTSRIEDSKKKDKPVPACIVTFDGLKDIGTLEYVPDSNTEAIVWLFSIKFEVTILTNEDTGKVYLLVKDVNNYEPNPEFNVNVRYVSNGGNPPYVFPAYSCSEEVKENSKFGGALAIADPSNGDDINDKYWNPWKNNGNEVTTTSKNNGMRFYINDVLINTSSIVFVKYNNYIKIRISSSTQVSNAFTKSGGAVGAKIRITWPNGAFIRDGKWCYGNDITFNYGDKIMPHVAMPQGCDLVESTYITARIDFNSSSNVDQTLFNSTQYLMEKSYPTYKLIKLALNKVDNIKVAFIDSANNWYVGEGLTISTSTSTSGNTEYTLSGEVRTEIDGSVIRKSLTWKVNNIGSVTTATVGGEIVPTSIELATPGLGGSPFTITVKTVVEVH